MLPFFYYFIASFLLVVALLLYSHVSCCDKENPDVIVIEIALPFLSLFTQPHFVVFCILTCLLNLYNKKLFKMSTCQQNNQKSSALC